MGVELVTVLANPFGIDPKRLFGLEQRFEAECPSLSSFKGGSLRRSVYLDERETELYEMTRSRACPLDIGDHMKETRENTPENDLDMSESERVDLLKRSWHWRLEDWDEELVPCYELNTRFNLYMSFYPQLLLVNFLEKVMLHDDDFCDRHLALSREVGRVLGAEEFLVVFDSAAPSSVINGDFVGENFQFQKDWLLENVGPPRLRLQDMEIEREDHCELVGYYLGTVERSPPR